MVVLPLSLKDCAHAAQLHQAAFYKGWAEKDFEDFLENPHIFGLKIQQYELTFYGYILWRETEDEAEILTLVISQPFQRRGMGNLLVIALFERLKEKGVSKLFLEVAEDNNIAKSFYINHGFVFLGKRQGYYKRPKNQLVDALNFVKVIGNDSTPFPIVS